MQTTKLVFLVMIGLAMIDFSIAQSLNAAVSTKASKPHRIAATSKRTQTHSGSMKGLAAVYSDKLAGRKTASGQHYCKDQLTAAHRSLPLGTTVRVTNLRNRQSVEVRITDRGPWHKGRVIDLSAAAAAKVGMRKAGIALVQLEIVTANSEASS